MFGRASVATRRREHQGVVPSPFSRPCQAALTTRSHIQWASRCEPRALHRRRFATCRSSQTGGRWRRIPLSPVPGYCRGRAAAPEDSRVIPHTVIVEVPQAPWRKARICVPVGPSTSPTGSGKDPGSAAKPADDRRPREVGQLRGLVDRTPAVWVAVLQCRIREEAPFFCLCRSNALRLRWRASIPPATIADD